MRRKHPFLLLFISLLVTTFFACKKTDEPTTAPTETESHSPQNADPKPESSDTQNPGAETNLLALEFLPNSTWFVATTRQPSKLTSLLDWERIEQRVPMHSPLLKSQFLTQLGLNLDGPAGFAMADLEQPGFLFFASRTPETGITKNPLPSLIAQSFPAAKTTAHGSQTQITLEATKDFPFCPCELVLTDKTLIALIHPNANTRETWVESIIGKTDTPPFIDSAQLAPLKNTLSEKPDIATYIDLASLIEKEASQLQSGIKATYNHAQQALEKVRREGGTPEVIAHWEKQVEKEEKWLADNKTRYENEADFFRTVYGSISSITLGIDMGKTALTFQSDIALKPDSLLASLFLASESENTPIIAPNTNTHAVMAGKTNWKTILEIIRRGMAADQRASEVPWQVDKGIATWLNTLTEHPLHASIFSSESDNQILFNGDDLVLKALWGPISETTLPSLMQNTASLLGSSKDSPDALLSTQIGGIDVEIGKEGNGIALVTQRANASATKNKGTAQPQKASLPPLATELLSRPNPTFQGLMRTGTVFASFFNISTVERAQSPRISTLSDDVWKKIQEKTKEIDELEQQRIRQIQDNQRPHLTALGWTALQLKTTSDGWRVEGGQFLADGTLKEQVAIWLEWTVFGMETPQQIDREIRSLRREIRLLKLRGDMPKGDADSIRSLPVMPSSP